MRRMLPVLLVGLFLAACGGSGSAAAPSSGGHVDVTLWHTQSEQNAAPLNDLIARFNAAHPNITVHAEFVGNYDQEYQKLLSAAKGGGLPDLAVAYENVVAELMKGNVIVPLDQYVNDPSAGLSKDAQDDIFPGLMEDNRYKQFNNQMLSFPFTKSLLMAYYDMDLLQAAGINQVPATWDDFAATAAKVADYAKTQNLPFNGAFAFNTDASTWDFEVMSRGGKLVTDDGSQIAFNNDAALQTLTYDQNLFKSNLAYQYKGFDWQNDFAAQKTAMHFDSSTNYAFLEPLIAKAPKAFKYVAAPPPNAPGQKVTVLYGANVSIFKSTPEKQAAAWQFIKWFTDTDQTAEWSIKTHYMPVRKSAASSATFTKELASNQALKASFDFLPYARPEPATAGWQAVRDIILNMNTAVVSGKSQPKAALDDAATKASKALADAK